MLRPTHGARPAIGAAPARRLEASLPCSPARPPRQSDQNNDNQDRRRQIGVVARFLPAWLLAPLSPSSPRESAVPSASSQSAATTTTQTPQTTLSDADYEVLLEKGRLRTLAHPSGQLQGRAGRRCTLEDGERYLFRCVALRPRDLRARVLLMRNLMRQATGRETEVPGMALDALRQAVDASGIAAEGEGEQGGGGGGETTTEETQAQAASSPAEGASHGGGLEACSAELLEDPSCVPALQVVLLALKALHAQQPPPDVVAAAAKRSKGGNGNSSPAAAADATTTTTSAAAPSSIESDASIADAVALWRARRLRAFVEAAGDVVPGLEREFKNVERRLRRQLEGLGPPGADARLRALVSREWLSAVDLAPPCGVVG